jgi:hypothetical protein
VLWSRAMTGRLLLALYRFGFAVLTLVGIVAVAGDLIAKDRFVPANFFSFFTIQSNLIAVIVFLVGAARWRSAPSRRWDLVRGASVVYLTVTLIVFALLLAGTDVDVTMPWVDFIVHRIMPIAVIIDWMVAPPLHRIGFRSSLIWLVYPLAWTAYTLVRGALTGWYPYPFLDPANGGYGSVAFYVVAILVFGMALCAIVAWVGDALGSRRSRRLQSASG